MIKLTRLNDQEIVLNAENIKFVEATPDTIITLTSGDKLIVKDDVDNVIQKTIQYARLTRSLPEQVLG